MFAKAQAKSGRLLILARASWYTCVVYDRAWPSRQSQQQLWFYNYSGKAVGHEDLRTQVTSSFRSGYVVKFPTLSFLRGTAAVFFFTMWPCKYGIGLGTEILYSSPSFVYSNYFSKLAVYHQMASSFTCPIPTSLHKLFCSPSSQNLINNLS